MSTATLDRPTSDEVAAFEMPPVGIGAVVRYYQQGHKKGNREECGIVLKINNKSVDIYVPGRMDHKLGVPHVDDPRLKINQDRRENGAWDFTEETLELRKTIASLNERMMAIEERQSKWDADALGDYEALIVEAKALGCDFTGRPKKSVLGEMVIAARKAAAQPKQPAPPETDAELN